MPPLRLLLDKDHPTMQIIYSYSVLFKYSGMLC